MLYKRGDSMKDDIGPENVPFWIDGSIILTDKNVKDWEKVPWAFFSKDERPDEKKEKIYSLGRLRFLEGWLYDNRNEYGTFYQEWYWAKEFKSWFKQSKKRGIITDTMECEGCTGSFWKFTSEEAFSEAQPGFWVLDGEWWRVYDCDDCCKSGAPPSLCQVNQYRYNRRLTMLNKVWGKRVEKKDLKKVLPDIREDALITALKNMSTEP